MASKILVSSLIFHVTYSGYGFTRNALNFFHFKSPYYGGHSYSYYPRRPAASFRTPAGESKT